MRRADQRAEAITRIQRVAHAPLAELRADAFEQRLVDLGMDDQPRGRRAVLTHVPERAVDHVLRHQVEVLDIVHHHRRVLAAALQYHPLEVGLGGVLEEQAAGRGGAGEADHRHVRVAAQRFAGLAAAAGDHVEHPGGDPAWLASSATRRAVRLVSGPA